MSKSVTFEIPPCHYPKHVSPMNYITRVFDRFLPTSRSQPPPAVDFTPVEQQFSPYPEKSSQLPEKHHSRKGSSHRMTTFEGPWSSDLESMKSTVQSMPAQYTSSFMTTSKETLETICNPEYLHIWEADSDLDNLLQLTSVVAKLCNLGNRKQSGESTTSGNMLIIAEDTPDRNNFKRLCQLIEYLTGFSARKHLEGTVAAYGNIVVARGWNNEHRSDHPNASVSVGGVVKRINVAIDRIFKSSKSTQKRIIWHHGPAIHFLLHWISATTSTHRKALAAITITGSLDLAETVKPSPAGRANTLADLHRLETFAKKLHIPVIFLDAASQLITYPYLAIYMIYYGYYISTFLPPSILHPHIHKAQDELVTFAFQLLGASKGRYGDSMVKLVKKHLDPGAARKWARTCIDARNYEKRKCKAAGREANIDRAGRLADSPTSRFDNEGDLAAFARLSVGPTGLGSPEFHTVAPVQIDFRRGRLRPSKPATFHVLVPAKGQDLEKVTNHVQGVMLAVLERVRQEKGNPVIGHAERAMWKAVVRACTWALDECEGKMPKDIAEKATSVKEKLRQGTWGYVLGAAAGEGSGSRRRSEGVSDAAKANADASAAYNAAKTMGEHLMAGQQGLGLAVPGYGGPSAPPNSPQVGAASAMYQGQGMPMPGYAPHGAGGYAPPRDMGGQAYQNGGSGWF